MTSLRGTNPKFPIDVNKTFFKRLPWYEAHSTKDAPHLATSLYLSIANLYQNADILVIGSGAGYIPDSFLRNMNLNSLILVDPVFPEVGSGSLYDYGNLFSKDYRHLNFYKNFMHLPISSDVAFKFFSGKINFDLIFIDGDHSYTQFTKDLSNSISCLKKFGTIICHDSLNENVSTVLDEQSLTLKLNILHYNIGAGVAIIQKVEEKSAKINSEKNLDREEITEVLAELIHTSEANKWNYLTGDGFNERIKLYADHLTKYLPLNEINSILEIGGNPNPLIRFFPDKERISVEPHISDLSLDYFKPTLNYKIVKNIVEIGDFSPDLIMFIGADLSLSKDFNCFTKEVNFLLSKIRSAKYIVLENAEFEPSRWLHQIFSQNTEKIFELNFKVQNEKSISLTNSVLHRYFAIYRVKQMDSMNENSIKLLVHRYAKYFQFDGQENIISKQIFNKGNSHEAWEFFNSWPVEYGESDSFVWLTPKQRISFPRKAKSLKFELIQPSFSIKKRKFNYSLISDNNILLIRRKWFFKNIKLNLPYFIPSQQSDSTDHRKLSFAVKSFEFF